MENKEKELLRRELRRIVRKANGSGKILAHSSAGTEVYDMLYAQEPDAKSPEDWLNSVFFIHELNHREGKIELEYQN